LGWTPYDYYTSLPLEFYAACQGYIEKKTESAKVIRFASFRIAESMAGSKAVGSIEKFWPMDDEIDKPKVEPMTPEKYQEIINRHKIKKENG